MRKNNHIYLLVLTLSTTLFFSADYIRPSAPPAGFTGETPGQICTNCHGSFELNEPGGLVEATLPSTYIPGKKYDFSVNIKHSAPNRKRWGFAIKAVAKGKPVGTFSTTNPNAIINSSAAELTHSNAIATSEQASFTYDRLGWTAPADIKSTDTITFYLAGNAASGGNGSSGDYIYSNVIIMAPETSTSIIEPLLSEDQWKIIQSNKRISIQLNLKKSTNLAASLFSASGQKVAEKQAQMYPSGINTIQMEGINLKSGTYIVVIHNEKGKASRKIIL